MPDPRAAGTHSRIPEGVTICGELCGDEDLIIQGRVEGQIKVPEHHLSIHRSGDVRARVIARVVTLAGTLDGTVVAFERVELLPGASMRGHLTTPSLLLMDGARFTGTVDPERTQAALRVARYRERQ